MQICESDKSCVEAMLYTATLSNFCNILFLAALGLLILSSSVTMLVPFCIGKLIDLIYSSTEDFTQMLWNLKLTCAGLSVVFLMGALANLGRVYIVQTAGRFFLVNYHSVSSILIYKSPL